MTSETILIVDDDPSMLSLCGDLLEEAGYGTRKASGSREALLELSQKPFHIVLSDIQMPGMDGVELLKEVRRTRPDTEVILMTAHAGMSTAIEAVRSGAYDYLTKPFSRENLLNSVRRCAEKFELNRKLKESQVRLVEQEKLAAVGSVSAWLAHRMRNSLSVILMCAHYLDQNTAPSASDDLKEVIRAILEKVRTLESITSDLITYSRPYDLQKTDGSLNSVLEDAAKSLEAQIRLQKLNVILRLEPGLPSIPMDPQLLHEVFENLLMNVLQAVSGQENQSVTLKTETLNGVENAAEVSIANTGSFIAPQDRDKIFKPFFTTKENGSGLGLAIAKKVVEGHGGKISVESTDDGGVKTTAFKMLFPVAS